MQLKDTIGTGSGCIVMSVFISIESPYLSLSSLYVQCVYM